ncbi:SIR2 family protein [Acidipropionibacterium jensenii]|uniref:SIR2 family NAD-dependent protein deacylase n=1 Tax=Acidipropionibacterium jensenii TaxID=1749 RepID=UPI000BC2DA46|nr:SIR2 family protein [Acidipropionibacterium jensenii]AZZ41656.1 SIR2 family protein [Acidipropionibacterium jensenii]
MKSIKDALRDNDVVLVIGTGVSAALTNNNPIASWPGLLDAGAKYLDQMDSGESPTYASNVSSLLSIGTTAMTVSAATVVATGLKTSGSQAFQLWLEESIGDLTVSDPAVAIALGDLKRPILTTNYDTLLEEALGRNSITWREPNAVQRALQGETSDIVHLHGMWRDAESVILADGDYSRLETSEGAQALQQGISALKTMVYIGVGDGLQDPNFGKLLEWQRKVFPNQSVWHYRLCLKSEEDSLKASHAKDRICPVPYGDRYSDLTTFLESVTPANSELTISPAGVAIDRPAEIQREFANDLVDQVRIGANDTLNETSIDKVIVPPVLLPMPYGEYTRLKHSDKAIQRQSIEAEISSGESLLLVSEEEHGLTTTLKWLALRISREFGSAIPVYLPFGDLRTARSPLIRRLTSEFVKLGYSSESSSDFPSHILAIDDFDPNRQKMADSILADLASVSSLVTLIGCRQGDEGAVKKLLDAAGFSVRVRYIGKLESEDVLCLARNAAPLRSQEVASQAMKVLETERLPRTPFSVSLIIYIILHGESVASSSQTAILDQFVSMLLGRGDQSEDARWGMDLQNRELLLSLLAERMVNEDTAGLSESEVIRLFDEAISDLGWEVGSASRIMSDFETRRVLRIQGRHVAFSRSSYLFLFAAKRAQAEPEFLGVLLGRALYYSPTLKANAALSRNNKSLLSGVSPLVLLGDIEAAGVSPYEEIELTAPIDFDALDESPEESRESSQELSGEDSNLGHDNGASELTPSFLSPDDSDRPPFPTRDPEDLPEPQRLMGVLDLVSMVLRDSDAVSDMDLKKKVLEDTLRSWGVLVRLLSSDQSFQEFTHDVFESLRFEESVSPSERADIIAKLVRVFPSVLSMGGVAYTLSSLKLLGAFRNLVASDRLNDDDSRLGALLFCFTLGYDGWTSDFAQIIRSRGGNPWVMKEFFLPLLEDICVHDHEVDNQKRNELLRLCADLEIAARSFSSEREKNDYRGRYMQFVSKRRLIESRASDKSNFLEG